MSYFILIIPGINQNRSICVTVADNSRMIFNNISLDIKKDASENHLVFGYGTANILKYRWISSELAIFASVIAAWACINISIFVVVVS